MQVGLDTITFERLLREPSREKKTKLFSTTNARVYQKRHRGLSKVMQDFPKTEGMFWAIYTTECKEY